MKLKLCDKACRFAMTDEIRSVSMREMAQRNLFFARILLPLILAAQAMNMGHVLFFTQSAITTPKNRFYFSLYAALFVFSAACLIFVCLPFCKTLSDRAARLVLNGTAAYVAVFCLWSAGITLLDMRTASNISVYLLGAVSVAILTYLRPWHAVVLFAGTQLFFVLCIFLFRENYGNTIGSLINTVLMACVCSVMSFSRYSGKCEEVNSRSIIRHQNQEIVRMNEVLSHQAVTDTLSGLYNRRVMDGEMPAFWKRCACEEKQIAVFMLDIDCFKLFNDTYGHQAGDGCIARIAQAMREAVGDRECCLMRYGGEEFSAFLPVSSAQQALALADDIRRRVTSLRMENRYAESHRVTISGGVYCGVPQEGDEMDPFLARADKALYRAKRTGKNKVLLYDKTLDGMHESPQLL